MRNMVKHAWHAGVCLSAGVVASIAVSWGAALLAPMGPPQASETDWPFGELVGPPAPGAAPEVWFAYRRWSDGPGIRYQVELLEEDPGGFCMSAFRPLRWRCDAGWPCRAFFADNDHRGVIAGDQFTAVDLGVFWSRNLQMNREVPTSIVWSGFAINVALFGFVPWIAWRGSVIGRHSLRLARDRCGMCGYDAGGLGRCPECGVTRAIAT